MPVPDTGGASVLSGRICIDVYKRQIYEDNKWKEGRRKEFQSWIRQRNAQTEEVRNLLYEKLKTVSSQETLYIENVGANTKYKYIPYGGYYTEKDEIVSDSYVKGDAKKYDIQYCPLGAFGFAALENTKSCLLYTSDTERVKVCIFLKNKLH